MLKLKKGKRIVIGLTGSFASGKTTVASAFKALGAKVIDADLIAHQAICPGEFAYKRVVKAFGQEVLNKDLSINRHKLGKMVFARQDLLKLLNRIVHPEVVRRIKRQIKLSPKGPVVLDAPLLVEAGLACLMDSIVVVKLPLTEQIKRARTRDGLKKKDVLKRIKAQSSLSDKVRLADFVIDNSGRRSKTKKQVMQICYKMGLAVN